MQLRVEQDIQLKRLGVGEAVRTIQLRADLDMRPTGLKEKRLLRQELPKRRRLSTERQRQK